MIYKIFGVKFHDISFIQFSKMKYKGLVVLPSGPGLATIYSNKIYHKSLKNADIALFDSGYFVLLLKLFMGLKVSKFSGYKFLKLFFNYSKNKDFFSVESDEKSAILNKKFLKKYNINIMNKQYVAPFYKRNTSIKDTFLLKTINKFKPQIVLINLGGGTQEVLGSYLKDNLNYKPQIICTGAAISYFTKQQAPITDFFDNLYLGWLIRCIFNPVVFIPRYLSALKLIFYVRKCEVKIIK